MVDPRVDKCLLALEDVLHQCGLAAAGFPGLADYLIARRTCKSHDIALRDLSSPERPGDSTEVELEDGTKVRLLRTAPIDCDGTLDLQGLATPAAINEALTRTLRSNLYQTRYRARSLAMARDVATTLRMHLLLLKSAGLTRRETLTR